MESIWEMITDDCFVRKKSAAEFDVLMFLDTEAEDKISVFKTAVDLRDYSTDDVRDLLYFIGAEDRYVGGMMPGDPVLRPELWAKEFAEAGYGSDIETPAGETVNRYQIQPVSFTEAKDFCIRIGAMEAAECF